MSEAPNGRAWVATLSYRDLKPIRFGTVFVRLGAPLMEVESVVRTAALEHLPDGFEIVGLSPGTLVFIPEGRA